MILKETFICLDCEATGLDPKTNRIVEIAIAKFRDNEIIESFETLINPNCPIPEEVTLIHNINNDMVKDAPTIDQVLKKCLKMIEGHIIVGHGIQFDIDIIAEEAKRHRVPCKIHSQTSIDTLRLARLYGQSPVNSLERLRKHFNITAEGAHRAMNDVVVNIQVFKKLSSQFTTTKKLLERLKKPIKLKVMPLGKYRGRLFPDIPIDYLRWAATQKFDQDLIYSIKSELKRRKSGISFADAANPFSAL